jgi:uncharacterized protein (DUF58 family)
VSALLAFAAIRNQDRVGAALLTDHLDLFLPPRRRRTHVLRLVREVLGRSAAGATDLNAALGQVLSTLRRRSVLFLVSDFLDTPYVPALKAAAARHDLIVVEIVDPKDDDLPAVAPVVLRDAETGRAAVVDGRRWRRRHGATRQRQREELSRLTRRLGVDHLTLRTDRPYMGPLVEFFERRRKRLRR